MGIRALAGLPPRRLTAAEAAIEKRARDFASGLSDAETQDDAKLVAETLTAHCPQTEQTAAVFAAFGRLIAKARGGHAGP